jgi:two-component system vancomycin resistance associated response regulator VraR
MEPIKLFIVEDDYDWLRGMTAYLNRQPDLQIIATATTAEEARMILSGPDIGADVALLDIMLDDEPAGIHLAEQAVETWGTKVIMLTSMEEKDLIFRSFQAGAIDYQIKSNFEQLPSVISAAHLRSAPINAAVAEKLREEFRRLKRLEQQFKVKEMSDLITPTELQVLEMIDQGHTQTEIAGRFFISLRTVKIHVGHILKKLGSSSSREAAQKVRELGLFEQKRSKGDKDV